MPKAKTPRAKMEAWIARGAPTPPPPYKILPIVVYYHILGVFKIKGGGWGVGLGFRGLSKWVNNEVELAYYRASRSCKYTC